MYAPSLHVLGLGVAANLAGLGIVAMAYPLWTAHDVFGMPKEEVGGEKGAGGQAAGPATASRRQRRPGAGVAGMTRLMAARDLAIAGAAVTYGLTGRDREMGMVIAWSMLFCAVDVVVVWDNLGPVNALAMAAVASVWGTIGYKLLAIE